ncbi:MAG: hypothetical protein ABI867_22030 [Kofleriaceae bacterium]
MHRLAIAFLLLAACGAATQTSSDAGDLPDEDAAAPDIDAAIVIPPDASTARCDPNKAFAAPVLAGRLASVFDDASLTLTRDERLALVGRESANATTILLATRSSATTAFAAPSATLPAPLNALPGTEHQPTITGDGLVVYFERRGTEAGIFVGGRVDTASEFTAGPAVTIAGVALVDASAPRISGDGATLSWVDATTRLLMTAPKAGVIDSFGAATVASTMAVGSPAISADGLTLFYASAGEILVATRFDLVTPFSTGQLVPELNSTAQDAPLAISSDGCAVFLKSTRAGGAGGVDIYLAERPL